MFKDGEEMNDLILNLPTMSPSVLSDYSPSMVLLNDVRATPVILINLYAHICLVAPTEVHNRSLYELPLPDSPEWFQTFLPL